MTSSNLSTKNPSQDGDENTGSSPLSGLSASNTVASEDGTGAVIPWDALESLESDPIASSVTPQLNSLMKKLSDQYGVNYDRSRDNSFESRMSQIPADPFSGSVLEPETAHGFVDPALECLDYLGINIEELTSRVISDFGKASPGIMGGVHPFLQEDFDFSLRGRSWNTVESGAPTVAFPKDQYSYGYTPPSSGNLHEWFAVPVGNATLLYDSEILSFRDSGVAVSLAIGVQNMIPAAGLLTAGCAAISLWQDLKVFSSGRTGIEKTKYALGSVADTAIIAGGIGTALKSMSPETRMGLVCSGFVGRLIVELIPNIIRLENRDQSDP